jgi:hypothetical protein
VGDDERGPLRALDDGGDGEGLPRPGDAEQHLMLRALVQPAHERLDGRRLIALRLKFGAELERHNGVNSKS